VDTDVDEGNSVVSVEDFGPVWAPGPFELGTDGPGLILAGVDASRTAMRAAAYAAGLARRQSSRLIIVYVASPSVWAAMTPTGANAVAYEVIESIAGEIRDAAKARAEELGLSVRFMVRIGDPFDELKRCATAMQADMVVVGASESAGHRLVGSLANRMVKAGKWPVTVVP
jgi:nucleotide-binding universal stress UspA family protein